LPAPRREYYVYDDAAASASTAAAEAAARAEVVVGPAPAYGHRQSFRPRGPEDFGEGGAFPEIPVLQYPRNMGNPSNAGTKKQVLATFDSATGGAMHDAVVVYEAGKDGRKVFSKFEDVVERRGGVALEKPSEEERLETLERTRLALQGRVDQHVSSSRSVKLPTQSVNRHKESTYVKYTASEDAAGFNPDAKHRLIRMVEAPQDPLEPPRHKHKKMPFMGGEGAVPVQHAPPKKLTPEDQAAWRIPPVLSNWKNPHGFTASLSHRLAVDGRRLMQPEMNERHAQQAHVLDVAEAEARQEVEARARLQQRLALKQKESKEQELRELAAQARMERGGLVVERGGAHDDDDTRGGPRERSYYDDSERSGVADRERMRDERRRERERELRQEGRRRPRDEDRDVSEKIALGMHAGGAASLKGEAAFDTRLFAAAQGIGSGFRPEDSDNVYSAPWRSQAIASIYRPTAAGPSESERDEALAKLQQGEATRFTSDARPTGAGLGSSGATDTAARSGPVQFQRVDDAFGIDGLFGKPQDK
jgi:SNW domain-containing protein 1